MDLIDQLETIEHEILKNNKLQIAILSQIDNIEKVNQKINILNDRVSKNTSVIDNNLFGHFDKLNSKIDNHYTILNDTITSIRNDIDTHLSNVSTNEQLQLELQPLQGDVITHQDIVSVMSGQKSVANKIKKLKTDSNKKLNIMQQNLDKSVKNIMHNQDTIRKNLLDKSTKCNLIPESHLPSLMKNQRDLAKHCIKYHKELRGEYIVNHMKDDIKKRKEYNDKYTMRIMKELLSIRKKITKKNRALSKLITKL
jgi:hypothetical protein